jgi:hypothetical protein
MITDQEVEFQFTDYGGEATHFFGIRKLGFLEEGGFIIVGYLSPAGALRNTLSTSIPISSTEYRQKNATLTRYMRNLDTAIVIDDDWGHAYAIVGSKEFIDQVVEDCIKHKVPKDLSLQRLHDSGEL